MDVNKPVSGLEFLQSKKGSLSGEKIVRNIFTGLTRLIFIFIFSVT